MKQLGPAFSFEKSAVSQNFSVQPDPGISPAPRTSAVQDMQLVLAIKLSLGVVHRDNPAERLCRINNACILIFYTNVERSVIGKSIGQKRIGPHVAWR